VNDTNQPPSPGGDPAQPPPDLPRPAADKQKGQVKDPASYGPVEERETPAPDGAPEPHQIF
jgi:hypothetical protein